MHDGLENPAGSRCYAWYLRVHSESHLDEWVKEYFGAMEICHRQDGTTVLSGKLLDLPQLYGQIIKLRDSGISILSLQAKRSCQGGEKQDKTGR